LASQNTIERIVDVAVELFNEHGTAAVSTNRIASAAGISPGNLYYHFRNKEEIILAAYQRALRTYDEVWDQAAAVQPSPETISRLLEGTFDAQWRFRFLQRELAALVQRDEVMRDLYRDVQRRRLAVYRALIKGWIAAGIAKPISDDRLDDLVTASWVVGDQWLAYLEAMGGAADEAEVRRGARLILEIFRPHLVVEF
jgi:AcrR family transcriptional regulator